MERILSDLHLNDVRTQLGNLQQLEPLLRGVQTLILNGDTCEMCRGVTAAEVAALKNHFIARVPEVVFITGNHDPDISDTHEWLGAQGRVWVTHGDACLDGLTPWSRRAPELRRKVAACLAADPTADFRQLEVRFRVARTVARAEEEMRDHLGSGWKADFVWLWRTFFPPRQFLTMLHCWSELPKLAASLAVAQRPTAQVVVLGHVHFPGVWRQRHGPVIVNTGSFFRPLGGNLVDVFDDRVEVRQIVSDREGFKPGRLLADIPLFRTI